MLVMLFDCTANLTAPFRTRRMQKLCHCSTQWAKFIWSEASYPATKKTASPWRLETRSRCRRRASSSGCACRLRLGQHWTITGTSICASPCGTSTRAPPTQTTHLVLLWTRSEPMLPLSRPPSTSHPLPQNFNLPITCAQTAQCVQVINCFWYLNSQLFFCYFSTTVILMLFNYMNYCIVFVNSSQNEQGLRFGPFHFAYTCVGDSLTPPTLIYLKLRLEFTLHLICVIYIYLSWWTANKIFYPGCVLRTPLSSLPLKCFIF